LQEVENCTQKGKRNRAANCEFNANKLIGCIPVSSNTFLASTLRKANIAVDSKEKQRP
jgi:hypothetical protein